MITNEYLNAEFSDYLNRYLLGIFHFKDRLEKIALNYSFSDAFGNRACRLSIEVSFSNPKILSELDWKLVNKYFQNWSNTTGSQFVSFIYQSQREHHIDPDVVEDFIMHYQFAQGVFEGFVRQILPETCILEVDSIKEVPFFNYIISFLRDRKWKSEKDNFYQDYKKATSRSFDFDWRWHGKLLELSEKYKTEPVDRTVSDVELSKSLGVDIENLRWIIIDKQVPFTTRWEPSVIDEIWIDASCLKKEMAAYDPTNEYRKINSAAIIKYIENKERESREKEEILNAKYKELGFGIGDYILVEKDYWDANCEELGLVKSVKIGYDSKLEVVFNKLKMNLDESNLPEKSTKAENISRWLSADDFAEIREKFLVRDKTQTIRKLKKDGKVNTLFKASKKVSKKVTN